MIRTPPHFVVEVEATTACTRNCWFCRPCLLERDRKDPPYLNKAHYLPLLGELAECGYGGWLVFCGHGEPLMHPDLGEFISAAKEVSPSTPLCLTTNGDLLTADWLVRYGPLLDNICWDCYEDDETSRAVPAVVRASGFPPAKMAVIDCTLRKPDYWLSRAGTGFKSPLAKKRQHLPCLAPQGKIFFSARGEFCLCCNDGHRRLSRRCSLQDWLIDPEYSRARLDLAAGFRKPYPQCMECEYFGAPRKWPATGLSGLFPTIDQTRFWSL